MPFLLLLIGALLFIVAYQSTHGDLATYLKQDVPPFMRWAAAIAAIGALGWVPGMRDASRWLLALVLVVIVLTNYKQMLAGLQSVAGDQTASGGGNPTPAQAAAAGQIPTSAQIEGTGGGTLVPGGALTGGQLTGGAAAGALTIPQLNFDPGQFLSGFGIGGL